MADHFGTLSKQRQDEPGKHPDTLSSTIRECPADHVSANGHFLFPDEFPHHTGVPSAYTLFIAVAGLLVNLLYPKLDFKSPYVVVKQSASTFVTFVVQFTSVAVPLALYVWLRPAWVFIEAYVGGVAVMMVLLAVILWHVARTRGVVWFHRLC
jgi:VIT1/CCC1 family predicted Fe2+/Mn2+ transporter